MNKLVDEILRQFIEVYNYPENPDYPGLPLGVSDGIYPMEIEGKMMNVLVKDGFLMLG